MAVTVAVGMGVCMVMVVDVGVGAWGEEWGVEEGFKLNCQRVNVQTSKFNFDT